MGEDFPFTISAGVTHEQWAQVSAMAEREGWDMSRVVRMALHHYFNHDRACEIIRKAADLIEHQSGKSAS